MARKQKITYYSFDNIDKTGAIYRMVIGRRSNGKTCGALMKIVLNYTQKGKQSAILRRSLEDFKNNNGTVMFDALYNINGKNFISEATDGKWDSVKYKSRCWYFAKYDEQLDKIITDETPFCIAFALSAAEHYKSTSYPNITIIVFDEFISRQGYLIDEFVAFMNILSTIIRKRDDVIVYMLGNTVNKMCPYFEEMGLLHVAEMEGGKIDEYTYGEDGKVIVAVEMCADNVKKKIKEISPSDIYFAFDNPKLKMITEGTWEIGVYPHRPCPFLHSDIIFTYFICFNRNILQCEIIDTIHEGQEYIFTFVHLKTTPLKDEDNDLIYSTDYSPRLNWRRDITSPETEAEERLLQFYNNDKVFYQDNNVGEIMRNYLMWCGKTDI